MPFVGVSIEHPLLLIGALPAFVFSVAGALSTRIGHILPLRNIAIQASAFPGGVFYSVDMLPHFLRAATFFKPVFHLVVPAFGSVFPTAALFFGAVWLATIRGPNLRV